MNLHGILLLNKPLNVTSNAAIQQAKFLFATKKAGHTGSLDPLATGMLPICFGEATKFSRFLLESDKSYRVTAQLGIKTSTGDKEGEVIATRPVPSITTHQLENIFKNFTGSIQQIPPMHSALKYQGKPLYELARKGIEIERQPRTIQIYKIQLLDMQPDQFTIDVHCSKGTYVRTLIEDIGEQLNCGAHVAVLHRTAVAPYDNKNMHTFEDLKVAQQEGEAALKKLLLPIETALQQLPQTRLSPNSAFYFCQGQAVTVPQLPNTDGFISVFSATQKFIGIGQIIEDGRLTPRRLIAQKV
jgi:tRNA pseudouridine55 synthase